LSWYFVLFFGYAWGTLNTLPLGHFTGTDFGCAGPLAKT